MAAGVARQEVTMAEEAVPEVIGDEVVVEVVDVEGVGDNDGGYAQGRYLEWHGLHLVDLPLLWRRLMIRVAGVRLDCIARF